MWMTDRGSVYGLSMAPLVAPSDFFEKIFFGLYWIRSVTDSECVKSPRCDKLLRKLARNCLGPSQGPLGGFSGVVTGCLDYLYCTLPI